MDVPAPEAHRLAGKFLCIVLEFAARSNRRRYVGRTGTRICRATSCTYYDMSQDSRDSETY